MADTMQAIFQSEYRIEAGELHRLTLKCDVIRKQPHLHYFPTFARITSCRILPPFDTPIR